MRNRIASGIGVAAIVVAALTGCNVSASVGGNTISQAELEKETANVLQPKFNVPITAHCKGGLKAEAGATQECVIEGDGQWQLVTTTATDDKGKFNANAIPGTVAKPDWVK
jgi:hypothetical protein